MLDPGREANIDLTLYNAQVSKLARQLGMGLQRYTARQPKPFGKLSKATFSGALEVYLIVEAGVHPDDSLLAADVYDSLISIKEPPLQSEAV